MAFFFCYKRSAALFPQNNASQQELESSMPVLRMPKNQAGGSSTSPILVDTDEELDQDSDDIVCVDAVGTSETPCSHLPPLPAVTFNVNEHLGLPPVAPKPTLNAVKIINSNSCHKRLDSTNELGCILCRNTIIVGHFWGRRLRQNCYIQNNGIRREIEQRFFTGRVEESWRSSGPCITNDVLHFGGTNKFRRVVSPR